MEMVLLAWSRWTAKKNTALAVAPDAAAAAVDEVDLMIQRLIQKEESLMGKFMIRTAVNLGFSLLIFSFLIYATYFRRGDGPTVWIVVLIFLLLLQSILTYQTTELTSVGIEFIQEVMSTEPGDQNPTLWKRIKRGYKYYFSVKSDGLYAEWILLSGEGVEIYVQVLMEYSNGTILFMK